jgi:hypothetical protein
MEFAFTQEMTGSNHMNGLGTVRREAEALLFDSFLFNQYFSVLMQDFLTPRNIL